MHITFLGFGWEQLGISQLSAIARMQGHSVGLAFSAGLFDDRYNLNIPFFADVFRDDDQVIDEIVRQQPDVLAFSPLTSTYQWMLMMARRSKQLLPGVITVFGGIHVSAVPERAILNAEVDYICVGEGDVAFGAILKEIQKKERRTIPNVWYKKDSGDIVKGQAAPFFQDLDALPIIDKTLWEDVVSFKDIYFTIASRGCPYQCAYCFNDYYAKSGSGRYVRFRSPEHVIRELKWAKSRYRLRFIEFEDDVFTLNRSWLKDLMALYKKEIDLPFQCLTHPKCMDEVTAKILKEAGCLYVQMGIQSMDDAYKHKILKRPETLQDVERALQSMKRTGLHAKIDHMFALPGEPFSAQEKALEIYRKFPPYRMQTFWTNYFPKTSIIEHALKHGLLSREDVDKIEEGKIPDDYRNSNKLKDRNALHRYKAYECLFKLLTVFPATIRKKIGIKIFLYLPDSILSITGFWVDLFSGLLKRNPDHWVYAKHYCFHIRRRLRPFHVRSRHRY